MLADIVSLLSQTGQKPRLVELGKIKIGGKGEARQSRSGGEWRMPRKDDHFTITTLHRTREGDLVNDTHLMDQLLAEFGDDDKKLRQIPVRVLSNDIDDVLQAGFVWYGGKSVGARSDGQTITWFNDPRDGKKLPEPKTRPFKPEDLEYKDSRGNKLLKLHAVFNCVIAASDARWGGVYKFRTTSRISFDQIYGSLLHIQQLTNGILVGMPLMLVVRPLQVSPDGKPTTVHVVHVELRGADIRQIQEQARDQAKYRLEFKREVQEAERQYKALLAPPGYETDTEAADITEEFHPESIAAAPAPDSYSLLDDSGSTPEPEVPEMQEPEPQDVETEPAQQTPSGVPDGAGEDWILDIIIATCHVNKLEAKSILKLNTAKTWDKVKKDDRNKFYQRVLAGEFNKVAEVGAE